MAFGSSYDVFKNLQTISLGFFYSTLFYFILFYFILFYFILFYFILFYFILFYFILFYFILFYFILFYFILFYFILFYFILFYFILFYFILFYFIFENEFLSAFILILKLSLKFFLGDLSFILPDDISELQVPLGGENTCIQAGYSLVTPKDSGFYGISFFIGFAFSFLGFFSSPYLPPLN